MTRVVYNDIVEPVEAVEPVWATDIEMFPNNIHVF